MKYKIGDLVYNIQLCKIYKVQKTDFINLVRICRDGYGFWEDEQTIDRYYILLNER